jgi:ubiquinone/menaquinone biosynthesis C-methylase UbiE
MDTRKLIQNNIEIHDKIAKDYDSSHGEIFTDFEQNRIKEKLLFCKNLLDINSNLKAFDFGCGSGNLSNHLLNLDFKVVGGDVSQNFLDLTSKKFSSNFSTIKLNGENLKYLVDNTFDLVSTYSVLHHVPDYMSAIKEMYRVLKPGGIMYLDHEVNEHYWNQNVEYKSFIKKIKLNYILKNWRLYLSYNSFRAKFRQIKNPRYVEEGDIHVFEDDKIEWDKIKNTLISLGTKIELEENYLLYKYGYKLDIYDEFKNKCSDYKVLIVRKL